MGVSDLMGTVAPPSCPHVELDTLRQEKSQDRPWYVAGFTCAKCPNPHRPAPKCVCGSPEEEARIERINALYPHGVDETPLRDLCGCPMPEAFTERCTECNTRMKRWTRAKKLEERILNVNEVLEDSFVAFVTLTIPNVADSPARGSLQDEVRSLKRRVASFRRRREFDSKIAGGVDVFENTVRPNGDWNIHHHGIWVMEGYWNQRDFQDAWGFRVRIERVRRPHAVMRYLTAYATKEPIEGVRCLETFKATRGSAYAAVEEYLRTQKDSPDAELAREDTASLDLEEFPVFGVQDKANVEGNSRKLELPLRFDAVRHNAIRGWLWKVHRQNRMQLQQVEAPSFACYPTYLQNLRLRRKIENGLIHFENGSAV